MTLPLSSSTHMAAQTTPHPHPLVRWPDDRRPSHRRVCRACSCCRSRKVRCDASGNGIPCTNCRLDGVKCVVSESKRIRKIPVSRAAEHGGAQEKRHSAPSSDRRTQSSHSSSSSSSSNGDVEERRRSMMDSWWDLDLISRLSCMQYQIQEQSLALHRRTAHEVDEQQWIPITISHEEPRVQSGADALKFLSAIRLAPGEWNLFSPVTQMGSESRSSGESIKEGERTGLEDVEWQREDGNGEGKEGGKEDENGISMMSDFDDLVNYGASVDLEGTRCA